MDFWEDFDGFLMDFGRIFGRVLMAFEVDFDRFLGGTGFVHFVLWTELNTSGFRGDFFGPWYFLEFQQIYIGLGTMRTIEWEYFFSDEGDGFSSFDHETISVALWNSLVSHFQSIT